VAKDFLNFFDQAGFLDNLPAAAEAFLQVFQHPRHRGGIPRMCLLRMKKELQKGLRSD